MSTIFSISENRSSHLEPNSSFNMPVSREPASSPQPVPGCSQARGSSGGASTVGPAGPATDPITATPGSTAAATDPIIAAATTAATAAVTAAGDSWRKEKNHWEICLEYAKRHIREEVESEKEEVANLLIFAGLFSAVISTFAVESYNNVKQDPADTTVLLLKSLVALQLNTTNPQPNLPVDLNPQSSISAAARRINIYNFLSLILTLTAVMVGIVYSQWLREYAKVASPIHAPGKDRLGILYARTRGMRDWNVYAIPDLLLIILILALLLFFATVAELLVQAHPEAAIITSVAIGISFLFFIITTTLPAIQCVAFEVFPSADLPQCPYKSPQAWISYAVAKYLAKIPVYSIIWAITKWREWRKLRPISYDAGALSLRSWAGYDRMVYSRHSTANTANGISWVVTSFLNDERLAEAIYKSISEDESIRWELLSMFAGGTYLQSLNTMRESVAPHSPEQRLMSKVVTYLLLALWAEKIEHGRPSTFLLSTRLEQFIELCQDPSTPTLGFPELDDTSLDHVRSWLSQGNRRQQLLDCLIKCIQSGYAEEAHLRGSYYVALDLYLGDDTEETKKLLKEPRTKDVINSLRSAVERYGPLPNGSSESSKMLDRLLSRIEGKLAELADAENCAGYSSPTSTTDTGFLNTDESMVGAH